MKVYVVLEHICYDGDTVRGVFSTKENAEDFADALTELAEKEEYQGMLFEVEAFDLNVGDIPWWGRKE